MYAVPLLAGAAVLGLIAAAGPETNAGIGEAPTSAGYNDLLAVMNAAELPADWQTFLTATAYRESKFHTDVGLGPNDAPGRPPWLRDSKASLAAQENEARGACKAYDKNYDKWFRDSKYPGIRYCFGSGGWFGFLPAYGIISGFRATPEYIATVDPWDVADPIMSVVMAVGFARGLMKWKQFTAGGGTWLTLRIGWGKPGNMGKTASSPKIRQNFAEQLAKIGVDPDFMDRKVTTLTIPKGGHLLTLIEGREAMAAAALGEAA